MSKFKGFHGPGGKGGLMRMRAFYCRKNPFDIHAQPLPRKQLKGPAQRDGDPRNGQQPPK